MMRTNSILILATMLSYSMAKLQFSPNRFRANIHEVHSVNLTSDSPLPASTIIEVFPLPNDKAAEISPCEIVVTDSSPSLWSLEITVKSYGVTSFIAHVKDDNRPDESGAVQVKVSHAPR